MIARLAPVLGLMLGLAAALALAEGDASNPYFAEDVVEFSYGLYCPDAPLRRDPAPGTASGTINIVPALPEFRATTLRIPATPGTGFGVTIRPESPLEVEVEVTHPPFAGTGVTTELWQSSLQENSPSLNGFTFDHAYELQIGTWTFTATADGRVIYTIAFDIVDPASAPELAGLCTGAILS